MALACLIKSGIQRKRSQHQSVPCAGLDSADLISQLRASHAHDAHSRLGVDVLTGGAGDMSKLGIFESFKVRSEAFKRHPMAVTMPLGTAIRPYWWQNHQVARISPGSCRLEG